MGEAYKWLRDLGSYAIYNFVTGCHEIRAVNCKLNQTVNVDLCRSAIRLLASLCAASASCQFCKRVFILSSIVGYLVLSNDNRIATGDSPNMSLNGVFCLSACLRLL